MRLIFVFLSKRVRIVLRIKQQKVKNITAFEKAELVYRIGINVLTGTKGQGNHLF